MNDYQTFLESKLHSDAVSGDWDLSDMNPALFDFQKHLTTWALNRGRAAIFADCGLGKTPMQLEWAHRVARKTNKKVLILTPLAVSHQTIIEGEKFGIECKRSKDGKAHGGITVTNYERLHHFDPNDFAGVVCDESSILKSFDGKYKSAITEFMRKMPYRLLATATAAPNDYIELGTSSEALGQLGYMDMLNRFFKNDQNNTKVGRYMGQTLKWRFKGHAEIPFWKWVCSWARAVRKPSDIGFDDGDFNLPPLIEREHIIKHYNTPEGMLFNMPAVGLQEERAERRASLKERCEKAAELADTNNAALAWCHLNDEGDLLEKLIPSCVQVSGRDSDDAKEEKLLAFARGEIRALVTKPKIGAWGLNFQHCSHVISFASHSFEQYYQSVRRCLRFGQKNTVNVDLVVSDGEVNVMKNLQRKAAAANKMFDELNYHMNNALKIERDNKFQEKEEVPSWL
jgi:hypothetical protein